ncbi:uncharacterized protein LOC111116488 [Crassostrea virginica]
MEGKLLILLLVTISASAEYKKYPTCPKRPPTKICHYKGQDIRVGQNVPAGDDCNTCTCNTDGSVRCTEKICFCDYQGRKIRVGQNVDAGDNCNTCTCQSNGQVTCTQKQCSHSPPVDVCSEPKPTCKGYLTRWYYNSYSSTCEQFTGCKGSGNNFYSRMACLRQCRKKSYAG